MSNVEPTTLWWLMAGVAVVAELLTGTFYLLMLATGLAAGALADRLQANAQDKPPACGSA